MSKDKVWSGRFKEDNNPVFERMNQSLSYDIRLYKQDILLNKVYAEELCNLGIITPAELNKIIKGLNVLEKEIGQKGLALFSEKIEDIHMGIEALLTDKIGLCQEDTRRKKSKRPDCNRCENVFIRRG